MQIEHVDNLDVPDTILTNNIVFSKLNMIWTPDERLYIGGCLNDKMHGYGTLELSNGCKIIGEFIDGLKHGKCKTYYKDGKTIIANYKNDIYDGYIRTYDATGLLIEESFYCDGIRCIKYIVKYDNNGKIWYYGCPKKTNGYGIKFDGKFIKQINKYENRQKVGVLQWSDKELFKIHENKQCMENSLKHKTAHIFMHDDIVKYEEMEEFYNLLNEFAHYNFDNFANICNYDKYFGKKGHCYNVKNIVFRNNITYTGKVLINNDWTYTIIYESNNDGKVMKHVDANTVMVLTNKEYINMSNGSNGSNGSYRSKAVTS